MLGSVHLESSGFLQRPGLCLWVTSAAHRLSPELKPAPLKAVAAHCFHVLILASSDFWGLLLQLSCTSPMASVFRAPALPHSASCQLLSVSFHAFKIGATGGLTSDLPAQGTTLAPLNHSFCVLTEETLCRSPHSRMLLAS